MIEQIKLNIKEILKSKYENIDIVIEVPKRGDADLAIPLFVISRNLNLKINEVYDEFQPLIKTLNEIKDIKFLNGFLNIYLKRVDLSFNILNEIYVKKDSYGSLPKNDKNVVIDYSSPNIAKHFTVGHLRSTVIGNSLKLIYEKLGYNVFGINHLGDWGTQFGKMIAAYKKWGNQELLENNPIEYLHSLYVRFHEAEKEDKTLEDLGRHEFLLLEQNNPDSIKLWQYFREISLNEFMKTYNLLNVNFDSYDGEAFYNDKMDSVVKELEDKKLLHLDEGAKVVYTDPNDPPAIIIRSDGATLYQTRDLAALFYRYKTYNFDRVLYVVGNEQKMHFKQLKEITNLMGYNFDIRHINFGLVLIDGKKMSSRGGKAVKLMDVIKEAIADAKSAIIEKNPNLSNKDEVARKIAVGAIIFNDLKNDRTLNIDFNLESMIKFEGQTGPYLQYSIVRIISILKNHKIEINKIDKNIYEKDDYFNLIKILDDFPNIIKRSINNDSPSIIAKYLLDLAALFNSFYGKVKVLDEDLMIRNTNLLLINSVLTVLKEGLRLLGIDYLEEM
ncbi:MAG: arginine--tRNA ligase [Acholeplasmataceae bacterium]